MIHILYVCLLFGAALLACHHWVNVRGFFASQTIWRASLLLGAGAMTAYGFAIFLYLLYPGYIDHIQSTVAAVSWLSIHGDPIYPDWHTQNVYGMLYGPLVYIVNGAFLLLSPTLFMSKLPGVLAFFLATVVMWRALKQKGAGNTGSFLLLATFILAAAAHGFYAYSNRTDSFLLLIATLMLPSLFMTPSRGIIITSLLAGIATGFKLHAAIYALPTALALLAQEPDTDKRLRMAAWGIAAGLLTLYIPFIFDPTPMLDGYAEYLIAVSHHGIGHDDMLASAGYALILSLPMAALIAIRHPILATREKFFLAGLMIVFVLTFLVSCKIGAGPHHFLPLLPAYIFGIVMLLKATASRREYWPDRLLSVFILTFFSALFGLTEYTEVTQNLYLMDHADSANRKIAELQKLIAAYPHAPVGVGDGAHYKDSDYRVLAVFQGAPLPIDIPAWMDLAFSGVDENVLTRFIDNCRIPVWIMPQGPAFSMVSGYARQPLFSDSFRKMFHDNYNVAQSGITYQAWVCKGK